MRGKGGDARELENSSRHNQGAFWGIGDSWPEEASKLTESGKADDEACRDTKEVEGAKNRILVTISVKQTGFYGSQLSTEVRINPNSHLLGAMAKEREKGKDPLEWFSDKITKEVRSLLCLVPGVSEARCASHTRLADSPDDATGA